jgi:hypothetical protein
MKPMFPCPYGPRKITYPCYIQPKLNGIRALYQVGHFQLPNDNLLRHLTKPLSKLFNESVILDGHLYVPNWSPDRLTAALAAPSEDTHLLEFHVSDVVDFRRPFESRFMVPASILTDTQHLHKTKVVETHRVLSAEPVTYFYNKWTTNGYDGLLYRLNGCPYTPGKSKNLLHRPKCPQQNNQKTP